MIDATPHDDGPLPEPANPIKDRRRSEADRSPNPHFNRVRSAPKPEAQPVWYEPPALSITEAAKRDYWAAWRRIKQA